MGKQRMRDLGACRGGPWPVVAVLLVFASFAAPAAQAAPLDSSAQSLVGFPIQQAQQTIANAQQAAGSDVSQAQDAGQTALASAQTAVGTTLAETQASIAATGAQVSAVSVPTSPASGANVTAAIGATTAANLEADATSAGGVSGQRNSEPQPATAAMALASAVGDRAAPTTGGSLGDSGQTAATSLTTDRSDVPGQTQATATREASPTAGALAGETRSRPRRGRVRIGPASVVHLAVGRGLDRANVVQPEASAFSEWSASSSQRAEASPTRKRAHVTAQTARPDSVAGSAELESSTPVLLSPASGGAAVASGGGIGAGPAVALLVGATLSLLLILSSGRLSLEISPWHSILRASPLERPG